MLPPYTAILLIGIPVLLLLWGVVTYNRFISLSRHADEAWSGVRVQLKRRHDLIPNLVDAVKGYMEHEKTIIEEITRLRAEALSGGQKAEKAGIAAENALSSALGKLFAVAEAYPVLRASENFAALQASLAEIEDALQMARRYYNGTVRSYAILRESFPSLIIAKLFAFADKPFFELDDESEAALPKVAF